jgi:hypothetical protein
MANLTLRSVKGSALTNDELDGNFEYFTGSYYTASIFFKLLNISYLFNRPLF